jgi:HEAT repeat protein
MVATSLSNCAGDPPNTRALDALITLTSDENSDVRDWATFGLGAQLDVDDEHIREALLARLDDPDGDTAGEAIFGLAARNDPRVIEEISHRLGQPDVGNLIVEVAAKMGDSRFLPFLRTLKGQGWDRTDPRGDWLDKAITACLEGPQWRA